MAKVAQELTQGAGIAGGEPEARQKVGVGRGVEPVAVLLAPGTLFKA